MHCSIILALGTYLVMAQTDMPPEKTGKSNMALAAQFVVLKAAMDDIRAEVQKRFAAAETEEAKEEVIAKAFEIYAKEGTPLADKALAFVASRPDDLSAVEVLTWILENHSGSDAANGAADLLIEHHLADPRTQRTASRFVDAPMAWTEKLLRALASADLPHDKQAQVLFQLAQCLKTKASMPALLETLNARMKRVMKLRFGEEYLAELYALDSAKLEDEAVLLFTRVADEYGTLADNANSAIYEIQNLGIGKTAPDISGEDIDGVAMSLSDYRGKVVMLDFWGHW